MSSRRVSELLVKTLSSRAGADTVAGVRDDGVLADSRGAPDSAGFDQRHHSVTLLNLRPVLRAARDVPESPPQFWRSSFLQMDIANANEALREVALMSMKALTLDGQTCVALPRYPMARP